MTCPEFEELQAAGMLDRRPAIQVPRPEAAESDTAEDVLPEPLDPDGR